MNRNKYGVRGGGVISVQFNAEQLFGEDGICICKQCALSDASEPTVINIYGSRKVTPQIVTRIIIDRLKGVSPDGEDPLPPRVSSDTDDITRRLLRQSLGGR